MRVSVERDDPGFVEDPGNYFVYFNGEKLSNCVTADEEKGIAVVVAPDESGRLLFSHNTEILKGDVRIEYRLNGNTGA